MPTFSWAAAIKIRDLASYFLSLVFVDYLLYSSPKKNKKKVANSKRVQSMSEVFLRLTSGNFFFVKRVISKVHVMRVNPKWADVPEYCLVVLRRTPPSQPTPPQRVISGAR